MNTTEVFDLGQLAEAAYGDFYDSIRGVITDPEDVQLILRGLEFDPANGQLVSTGTGMSFSETQAHLFTDTWAVEAHQSNTPSGFSATLFRNKTSGELVYATRGTEGGKLFNFLSLDFAGSGDALADIVADTDLIVSGLAVRQIVDMYNDWQRLSAPQGEAYEVKVLEPYRPASDFGAGAEDPVPAERRVFIDNPLFEYTLKDSVSTVEFSDERMYGAGVVAAQTVTATGHSLGGHLAHSFNRLFGSQALGINGAGFAQGLIQDANIDNLFRMLGGSLTFSGVRNIYGELGVEATTQPDGPVLHQQGATDPLYIEDALGNTFGHGKEQMTDSLAVADLFIRVSPELQAMDITAALARTNALFEAASATRINTLENTARYLGLLFNAPANLLDPTPNDREALFKLIDAIRNSEPYKAMQTNGGDFELLTGNAEQLKNLASTSEAVRYSLLTLTPFIVTGAGADALYANHADELRMYDPSLKQGGMTDNYLRDRAKMLAMMLLQADKNRFDVNADSVSYTDVSANILANNDPFQKNGNAVNDKALNQQIIFGGTGKDVLIGGEQDDFLYGGDEVDGLGDKLMGGLGSDYMEGGAGDDTYYAGDGDTIVDTDGVGRVLLDGAELSGGTRENGQSNWTSDDGAVYSLENGVLSVSRNGSSITINDFEEGELGIALNDIEGPPQRETYTKQLWYGTEDADGKLTFDPGILRFTTWVNNAVFDSKQYAIVKDGVLHPGEFVYAGLTFDASGVVVDSNQAVHIDTLATEKVKGVHNDFIQASSGDDHIKTYAGMDFIYGGLGDDKLEGGADSDELQGQLGNDRLYATSEAEVATLFNPDAIATDSSKDYLHGGEGHDQLYGSAGANLLDGGAGNDLIAAGAGNDFIIGDGLYGLVPHIGSYAGDRVHLFGTTHDISRSGPFSYQGPTPYYDYVSQFDWIFTISGDAATGFSVNLSAEIADLGALYDMPDGLPTEQHGDDVIYAGAGEDFVNAGAGDDFVHGGRGRDLIWGEDGNDLLNGGLDDDFIVGDGSDTQKPGNDVLIGEAGNDMLIGGLGADSLDGGDGDDKLRGDSKDKGGQHGDDRLNGGKGADDLRGQGGSDHLVGGEGDDILAGDDTVSALAANHHGNDHLEGGAGMDSLWGGGGNDQLHGGADNDLLLGDADDVVGQHHGADRLYGESGDDVLIGQGGDDFLSGGTGADTLHGDDAELDGAFHGNDTMYGGDGADRMLGFGGDDVLLGGEGNDIMLGDDSSLQHDWHGNDVMFGEAGDDNLQGQGGDDSLSGGVGADSLSGGDGDDTLMGGEGNDSLFGDGGADMLSGDGGNDVLSGGAGNDLLIGGSGNDNIRGGSGNDSISGGADEDFLFGMENDDDLDGGGGNDQIYGGSGNDRIVGGDGADYLIGDAGDDVLSGGAGSGDYLEGGAGNDSYLFALGDGNTTINNLSSDAGFDALKFGPDILTDEVSVFRVQNDLGIRMEATGEQILVTDYFNGAALDAIVFVDGSSWTEDDIKSLVISPTDGNDNFLGYAGDDVMFGGAGDDTLFGNEGDDRLDGESGQDTLHGGDGDDRLHGGEHRDLLYGEAGKDWLYGDAGDDQLYGEAGDDHLFGGQGRDELVGGAGNDHLSGGPGDGDSLIGGAGADTYYFGPGDGNTVIANHDTDGGYDVLEFRAGISAADILVRKNTAGDLSLTIRNEAATIVVQDYFDDIHARLDEIRFADGTTWNSATINTMVLAGSEGADDILGLGTADVINALGGDDFVGGSGGNDSIDGGEGNDTLHGGDGDDFLSGGAGQDSLFGGAGNDILRGGAGSGDYLAGGDGNDIYVFALGEGNTTIDISGSDSQNINRVETVRFLSGINPEDLSLSRSGDLDDLLITIAPSGEIVTLSDYFSWFSPDFKPLSFEFADGRVWSSDEIYRSFSASSVASGLVLGSNGNDLLLAQGGNDLVYGDGGSDTIDGGNGNDILYGGDGDDVIEGGFGEDSLFGGDGNDTLSDNGGVNETSLLDGGAGQDTYLVGDSVGTLTIRFDESDKLKFTDFNPENVTISRNIKFHDPVNSHSYADNNLILEINKGSLGNDGVIVLENFFPDGIGNDQRNTIEFADGITWDNEFINDRLRQGTQGDDVLVNSDEYGTNETVYPASLIPPMTVVSSRINGFGGNDRIYGGIAHEMLDGGDGDDVIQGHYGNDSITGGNGDDWLHGGGHNDVLFGGSGSDTLKGGAGNDILVGGPGSLDFLEGNQGNDLYIFAPGDGDTFINNDRQGYDDSGVISSGISDHDTLLLPGGVDPDGVRVLSDANNLYLRVLSSGELITVGGFFNGPRYELSEVMFAGGIRPSITWDTTDLKDMAAGNTNQAPTVEAPVADQSVAEGAAFNFSIPETSFTDADTGEILRYSASLADGSPLPLWLSFDAPTRTFSGTPDNIDVGVLSIRVTASDGISSVSDDFNLLISNVNDAPVVAVRIVDQSATQDTAFSFTVPAGSFIDIDADDTLSYSATLADGSALPVWLNFNPQTLTFSGIPDNDEVGALDIRLTASDGELSSSDTFELNVVNVNDAPILLESIDDQQTREGEQFAFSIPDNSFVDIDSGDVLSYAATLADGDPLPSWLTFDAATRTFSGIPENDAVGEINVTVTATDAVGAQVSDEFVLAVSNVNDDPVVLNAIANQQLLEDTRFTYTLPENSFHDVDVGDVLVYSASLADGDSLPAWLSFDSLTQTFSGTPDNDDVGKLNIRVTASDGVASVSADFGLVISNVNDAPVVEVVIPDQSATEGSSFNYTVPESTFSDVDIGDELAFSASLADGEPLPAWLKFDASTRTFSGTPQNSDVGTIDVQISARDLSGAMATDSFELEISSLINQVSGSEGSDYLRGSNGADIINSLGGNDVLLGYEGNDILQAGAGQDRLYGYDGADVLSGGDGNDLLYGMSGDDHLNGGTGRDYLYGGSGNDVYEIATGDGYTSINNWDRGLDAYDVVRFSSGIAPENVRVTRRRHHLRIRFEGSSDLVEVSNHFHRYGESYRIDAVEFSDGTVWDQERLREELLTGRETHDALSGFESNDTIRGYGGNDSLSGHGGDDTLIGGIGNDRLYGHDGADELHGGTGIDQLYGMNGDDYLVGGEGRDYLDGGAGSDTYLFSSNSGADIISNFDTQAGSIDIARFDSVASDDLWFRRAGNNLLISVAGTSDEVTLHNWYLGQDYQLDRIEAGESALLNTQIEQLVTAMASYNVPSGVGNVIPPAVKEDLAVVLANSWQAA